MVNLADKLLMIRASSALPPQNYILIHNNGGASSPTVTKTGAVCTWYAYQNGAIVATYTTNSPAHIFSAGTGNKWVVVVPADSPVTAFNMQSDVLTQHNLALPSVTNLPNAWYNCASLTSFSTALPLATNCYRAWALCDSLASFSTALPSAISCSLAWYNCSSLTSFSTALPSATSCSLTWYNCSSLTNFSAGLLDAAPCKQYTDAFVDCALTQQSVDNILVSIKNAAITHNLTAGTLNMTGGTSAAPSATGLAAKSILVNTYGWTVTHN